jgi:hypothetical protein
MTAIGRPLPSRIASKLDEEHRLGSEAVVEVVQLNSGSGLTVHCR